MSDLRRRPYLRVVRVLGLQRFAPATPDDWEWARRDVLQARVREVQAEADAAVRRAEAQSTKATEAAAARVAEAEREIARLRARLGEVLRQRRAWRQRALRQPGGKSGDDAPQLVRVAPDRAEWVIPIPDVAPDASRDAVLREGQEALARYRHRLPRHAELLWVERAGQGWRVRVRMTGDPARALALAQQVLQGR